MISQPNFQIHSLPNIIVPWNQNIYSFGRILFRTQEN